MKKNTVQTTNDQVIKEYFQMDGSNTKTGLMKFLFDMQTNFILSGEDWEEEYRNRCLLNFETLFNLVNGLTSVEDKVENKISLN